ncbi:hypothetical protein [Variovorax rhizosphaerae]|uniref:Uncharacterized protein n=1 Tax=Variovorax rhizosphaerae TaxID=1836200 RepID=A0ABU8WWG7_9BURK
MNTFTIICIFALLALVLVLLVPLSIKNRKTRPQESLGPSGIDTTSPLLFSQGMSSPPHGHCSHHAGNGVSGIDCGSAGSGGGNF